MTLNPKNNNGTIKKDKEAARPVCPSVLSSNPKKTSQWRGNRGKNLCKTEEGKLNKKEGLPKTKKVDKIICIFHSYSVNNCLSWRGKDRARNVV